MERIVEVIQRIQGESKFMKKEKMGDFSLKNVIWQCYDSAVVISAGEQEKHVRQVKHMK